MMFLALSPAYATRVQFVLHAHGQDVSDAEACFFRVAGAYDPLAFMIPQSDVGCLPAANVIELPPGDWVFFFRSSSGLVNVHRTILREPPNPLPEFRRVNVEMVPSGSIDVSSLRGKEGDNERLLLFVADSRHGLSFTIPVTSAVLPVPSDVSLVLMRIRGGTIRSVTPAFSVRARSTMVPPPFEVSTDTATVIAWVLLDRSRLLRDGTFNTSRPPPVVELNGEFGPLQAEIPFPPGVVPDMTLVFFRHVPSGLYEIRATGDEWQTTSTRATVSEPGATLVEEPLPLRLGCSVEVSLVATAAAPRWTTVSAEACIHEDRCQLVSSATVGDRSEITFGSLPPGRLDIRFLAGGEERLEHLNVPAGCDYHIAVPIGGKETH